MSRLTNKLEPALNVAAVKFPGSRADQPVMLSPRSSEDGFTLIELLVVVLVIGILAAIAIPAFLGQRDKADNADAKANVNRLAKMVEECRLSKSSFADCDTAGELGGAPGVDWGYNPGQAGAYDVYSSAKGYGLYAVSSAKAANGRNRVFAIVKDSNGSATRMCADSMGTALVDSVCPQGTW